MDGTTKRIVQAALAWSGKILAATSAKLSARELASSGGKSIAGWRSFYLIFSLILATPEFSWAQTGLLQPGQVLGNNGTSSAVISSVDTNTLNAQTSSYSIATTDCGKTILAGTGSTGQFTVTLPSTAGFPSNCAVLIKNGDTGSDKVLSGFPSDLGGTLYPLQSFGVKIVNGGWQSFYSPAPLAQPGAILGVDAKSQSLSALASPQPIIPWSPQVHQDGGGVNFGHNLMWADQNTSMQADLFSITTGDQSILQSFTIGGTPAAGNTLTITFTLATTAYPVVYTVQAGDTTATIAAAMAACVAGGSTHCTGGATFVAALLAFHGADGIGYRPAAGANGSTFVMDFPWAASGNSIAVSATGGGATISGGTGTNLDNGPIITTGRNVPGRTPVAGDQPFNFQMGCQSGPNTSIDTTCGSIPLIYLGTASAAHVYATLAFGAAANSNQGPIAWYVGPMGVYTADAAGDGNGCGGFTVDAYTANDPGFGNISVCNQLFVGVAQNGGPENPSTRARFEVNGVSRVLGSGSEPTTGAGIETFFSSGIAIFLAYNHDTSSYLPIYFQGSQIALLQQDATHEIFVDTSGVWPNTDNAVTSGKTSHRWANVLGAIGTFNSVALPGSGSGTSTIAAPATGGGALTLPPGADTIAGLAATQTLTNKTLSSSTDVLGGVTMTLGSDVTGDIYYRNSGGILTRLGIGSSGQYLGVSGGLPAWGPTGITQTCTVNQAKTLIFTNGILTGGTCNS